MQTLDRAALLALVRHGRTDWNAQNLMQGRTDRPLDAEGWADADRVATVLPAVRSTWGGVVTSPLRRAVQTGERIADTLGVPRFPPVDDLAERAFGQVEGMDLAEVRARFPDGEYPGAEPRGEATARGLRGLTEVADRYTGDGRPLVVVSHGGLLRDVLMHLLGRRIALLGNGDVSLLERTADGEWRVDRIGEQPADVEREAEGM